MSLSSEIIIRFFEMGKMGFMTGMPYTIGTTFPVSFGFPSDVGSCLNLRTHAVSRGSIMWFDSSVGQAWDPVLFDSLLKVVDS